MDAAAALEKIFADPRYQKNLDWGEPRSGHPEGTIRAHLAQLEANLARLEAKLSPQETAKLRLLIHTHDTFKPEAKADAAIVDPRSHASLARAFLAEYCSDEDLLAMVQYHDEPYALWRQLQSKGAYNHGRLAALVNRIRDWDLFLAFLIVDGCTPGKSRQPLHWLFGELRGQVASRFTQDDILDY